MERDKLGTAQQGLKTAFARQSHKNASDAERRLWSILSRKHIKGERFKRHEPIGPYLVDFYCPGAKLVIDLDNGLPDEGRALEAKMQWLTSQGYRVLRVAAEDVRRNPWSTVKYLARRFRARDLPRNRFEAPSMRG